MAVPGTEQYHSNPLFVSPDNLMLHHDRSVLRGETQEQHTYAERNPPSTHHQTVWASQQAEQRRTSLPLHGATLPGWSYPGLNGVNSTLPPTPISPFRPLQLLSEDAAAAFPCPGGIEDCWNPSICPKHRAPAAVKREQPPSTTPTPPAYGQYTPPVPNPRRRSAPAGDEGHPPPAKMQRYATDPEHNEPELPCRYHQHSTATARDARASNLAKGRVPHNLVERRYRDNLNGQIEALRMTLPSLRDAVPPTSATATGDLDDNTSSSPRMPSKAVIISTAANYIRDMENERNRLLAANRALQEQVASLQKLIRCDDCDVLQYLNAIQLSHHAHLPTPS